MNWNRTILKALSRLRESDRMEEDAAGNAQGRAGWTGGGAESSGLPLVCLLSAVLCILLCALSKNAVFTATVFAVLLLRTAFLPVRQLRRTVKALILPVLFTLIIMLPSVFLGSPGTMLTVVMKVAEAVLVLALMGTVVPFQRMTEALRQLHLPDIFVLVLDLTIRYLVILGRYSASLLEAVTLRSVGKVNWRDSGAGGILGTTFLKAQQMARETEEAMRMRGFDGTYPQLSENRFSVRDAVLLSADACLIFFFAYTQTH